MLNEQDFFDALSDEIRRRILALLLEKGELCVCELQYALDLPQPKVSRHLAVMREAELLSMRRDGTWIYYRAHPQLPLWAYKVLENFAQGAVSTPLYQEDKARLEAMANRPARCCA
jgi:ArsR family transcriptional regulator